jgi:hypothetical protein
LGGVPASVKKTVYFIFIGVLNKNPDLFNPPLPEAKYASMKNLVFGVVNKIFLAYEKPFLNPDISEVIVLWNKVDEAATPMEERWFRKIYSFCKGKIITLGTDIIVTYNLLAQFAL